MLALDILRRVANLPTATFYEDLIRKEFLKIIKEQFDSQVETTQDKFGNVIVHYKGDSNREQPKCLAYVAHMDHPAFHCKKSDTELMKLKMAGGLNPNIIVGSKIKVITRDYSSMMNGKIVEKISDEEFFAETEKKPGRWAFAILDLPELIIEDDIIRAPVLDDLAGAAMSLAALKEIVKNKPKVDVYVVLHIAEEIGLIGAYLIAQQKVLPKETMVISVETSSYKTQEKQLAQVGGGIVIRSGDKRVPEFNKQALSVLRKAGESMTLVQDLLMNAGGCEAGIYHALGYRVAGVCMPLIAWHNNGVLENKNECIPEGVHLKDFETGVELLTKSAIVLAENPQLYTFSPVTITEEQEKMHQSIKRLTESFTKQGFLLEFDHSHEHGQ